MLYQRELPTLGHIVSTKVFKPNLVKVEAIQQMPPLWNKSQVPHLHWEKAYV